MLTGSDSEPEIFRKNNFRMNSLIFVDWDVGEGNLRKKTVVFENEGK